MTNSDSAAIVGVVGIVVEEQIEFTLIELSRACCVDCEQLTLMVTEGVLDPSGGDEQSWLFDGGALRRARAALRLHQDLDLRIADIGFVLDLLEEIESLKLRLRRLGQV